jgi:tRNA threonylcarbamoyladenosine biosynthesis protein TsaE
MKFNIEEIQTISEKIIKYLENCDFNNSTVLALHGNLGAGKTTLTQNLAISLGIQDVVNSPTFVIQKKYNIEQGKYKNLIHIDAYRLTSIDEVKILGLEKEFKKKENLIIIEWPDNLKEVLPSDLINIYLDHTQE